ncbi:adenylosuccinate synthetase [Candidatus Woesearchaeota archaeon]|nr:adenylosuccinate synthetase [Candidatus Woesearchaeota archaeon]
MELEDLVKDVQVLAIICNQYGDTGKGKYSNFFAALWADVIGRGTGGNNAGHTVVLNEKERIFHLIPAGITYDNLGKINILGNGMVIDPEVLCDELDYLDKENLSYNNLMISKDANVIFPYHIERDVAKDKSQRHGGIGTTGRGIGPCYTDKIARRGIMISDLFHRDVLIKKIRKAKEYYPEQRIDEEQIISDINVYSERIKPFVADTVAEIHRFIKNGKKICLEGAQGLLLSVEHGIYPYVTSSDCSLNGTATGVGLSARAVDLTLGIIKFPFMTKVGGGPFPTELGGITSEEYCSDYKHGKLFELDKYTIPYYKKIKPDDKTEIIYSNKDPIIMTLINRKDEFLQGIGIRLAACEYGATTGRPRRIGWTDGIAARYAVGINGPQKIILTKADAISGADEFNIAYGYKNNSGAQMEFTRDSDVLRNAKPDYKTYEGYQSIYGETNLNSLPKSLIKSIEDFENFVGAQVAIISTGPEQRHTIIRN